MNRSTNQNTVEVFQIEPEETVQSTVRECTTEASEITDTEASEITATLVALSAIPYAKSLVSQLYPDSNGYHIKLKYPYQSSSGTRSQHDLYRLELSHPNYQAIYSAALAAALNRLPLLIRTKGPITSTAIPTISYVTITY